MSFYHMFIDLIEHHFVNMFESGRELVVASQSRSVTYQRFSKVRSVLYAMARMKKRRLDDWTSADILDFVIAIDKAKEYRLADGTLMSYYKAIKDCFHELDINTFETQTKTLNCAMNLYRQERRNCELV